MVACGIRRRVVGCWRLIRPGRVTTRRGRCVCAGGVLQAGASPVLCAVSGVSCTSYPALRIAKPAVASSSSSSPQSARRLRRPWAVSAVSFSLKILFLKDVDRSCGAGPQGAGAASQGAVERALPSKYTPYSAPLGCCLLCSGGTGPGNASCNWRLRCGGSLSYRMWEQRQHPFLPNLQ